MSSNTLNSTLPSGSSTSSEATLSPRSAAPESVNIQAATTPEEVESLAQTINESSGTFSGRNLVVCIDGTANQFSLNNTHVVELYSRLEKSDKQLTYYNSGIGTFVKHSNWIGWIIQLMIHVWDMMVAWNLKRIVLGAYQWLSENYQPGDRIYLFGFSRGAYQVRIIAGMISVVGLLHKGNNDQIGFAYELYLAVPRQSPTDNTPKESPDDGTKAPKDALASTTDTPKEVSNAVVKIDKHHPAYPRRLCERFKETLCHSGVIVHLVGAWDTVSSVGVVRGPTFPETTTGMNHVRHFLHCLSLDERRNKFVPEYSNGGSGPGQSTNVKEVWFAGSHSDIGGGISENLDLNSFGPPLRWMLYEAMDQGLRVKPFKGAEWRAAQHHPSMSWVWKILEYLPIKRLAYDNGDGERCTWWPNRCGGRQIQPGQLIHSSVIEFMKEDPTYIPAAKLYDGLNWQELAQGSADSSVSLKKSIIIQDLYVSASDIVSELESTMQRLGQLTRHLTDPLGQLAYSTAGEQSIIDVPKAAAVLLRTMTYLNNVNDLSLVGEQRTMMRTVLAALGVFPSIPEYTPLYSYNTIEEWTHTCGAEGVLEAKIKKVFGKNSIHDPLHGHSAGVYSVAYSPNGKFVASCSADETIRLWDAQTGHPVGELLRGHTNVVRSVAFSPDGARIASGSNDKTIRIWDAVTHQPVGSPLTRHDNYVLSVAFSPAGEFIVSGSREKTVRVWDAGMGSAVGEPLRGHTITVFSVAISSDGRQIASGSGDHTVRIWDFETREAVRVLKGHSGIIWSVAFTPDGKRVVTGSSDETIRVWDIESGESALGPLRGHENWVYTVAVSPDGKYIASGGGDATVRLWDAETGEPVGEPLRGHEGSIYSVAFSPDGSQIVSGSEDETLRIWDVDISASTSANVSW